jgi:hypothetical protein
MRQGRLELPAKSIKRQLASGELLNCHDDIGERDKPSHSALQVGSQTLIVPRAESPRGGCLTTTTSAFHLHRLELRSVCLTLA